MNIALLKATLEDSEQVHKMQVAGFKALLDKYQDFDTNPGNETLEKVKWRFTLHNVDQYLIVLHNTSIGYIRIQRRDDTSYRLSQMFILPEHQEKGYAQQAILKVEALYPNAKKWSLDTIKQESKLCYLYEKMGYKLTGVEKKIKDGMDLVDYAK